MPARTRCCTAFVMLLLLLTLAPAASAQTEAQSGSPILQSARQQAVDQILAASRSDNPALRANAIEAMQPLPERARPLTRLGLEDENPGVRFAALATAGELGFEGLSEAAAGLTDDPNPSVRAAALLVARKLGRDLDVSPVAKLFASPDPAVRGNVATLLGRFGEPSAKPMMQALADRPMPRASGERAALVRLQIAEAFARLGDDSARDVIRAAMFSAYDEQRVMAVQALGRLEDRQMEGAIRELLRLGDRRQPPIEIRLAAVEALAQMGAATDVSVMLEGSRMDIPPVRAQAAFALGQVASDQPRAARRLVELLEDPEPAVRLSAAAAVLRALEDDRQAVAERG